MQPNILIQSLNPQPLGFGREIDYHNEKSFQKPEMSEESGE